MADFCLQCAEEHGFPDNDLRGILTKEEEQDGLFLVALCEGCGPCYADHDGRCHSHEKHDQQSLDAVFAAQRAAETKADV